MNNITWQKLYPNFPIKKRYDIIYLDPPWRYSYNT